MVVRRHGLETLLVLPVLPLTASHYGLTAPNVRKSGTSARNKRTGREAGVCALDGRIGVNWHTAEVMAEV
jgi:hypothetical protein